jgi:hypothetical protein
VIPDNQDPRLAVAPAHDDFWGYIRECQARGWTIAMHGCHHLYETQDPGLLGINPHSEFAGLPAPAQREKINKALAIFAAKNVRIDAWIAPAHSFDKTTVEVLLQSGVSTISDGFYTHPVQHLGAIWIPQQIWRFRDMPTGLWTVCLHANNLTERSFAALERGMERHAHHIIDLKTALKRFPARPLRWIDRWFARAWLLSLRLRTWKR